MSSRAERVVAGTQLDYLSCRGTFDGGSYDAQNLTVHKSDFEHHSTIIVGELDVTLKTPIFSPIAEYLVFTPTRISLIHIRIRGGTLPLFLAHFH